MLVVLHLIVLLLATNIVAEDLPQVLACGENEEEKCGPICIETCDYKPDECSKICRVDCYCKDGYVRQSNETGSPCIKLEDCKKASDTIQCGQDEEYQECGSSCPPSCDDFTHPLPKEPKICSAVCQSGCFCKEGYYRATDGQCVGREECCTENNEEYTDCGPACVETCNDAPEFCTDQCVSGCFCISNDYIRQNKNSGSACIKREQCSK